MRGRFGNIYLENLEPSVSNEIKMTLMYITGYTTRSDHQTSEYGTYFYYKKYGKYNNSIDHGKRKVPYVI